MNNCGCFRLTDQKYPAVQAYSMSIIKLQYEFYQTKN